MNLKITAIMDIPLKPKTYGKVRDDIIKDNINKISEIKGQLAEKYKMNSVTYNISFVCQYCGKEFEEYSGNCPECNDKGVQDG